jgi:hypothetical protein
MNFNLLDYYFNLFTYVDVARKAKSSRWELELTIVPTWLMWWLRLYLNLIQSLDLVFARSI